MAHKCIFTDEIKWDRGKKQFYLATFATGVTDRFKDQYYEVIKEYPNGDKYARSLSFNYLGGYSVSFPGEKYFYRYSNDVDIISDNEPFEKIDFKCNLEIDRSVINKKLILRHAPELKYLLEKYQGTENRYLFKLIEIYKTHPEVESLVILDQLALATDKRLWNLSKKKKQEIINFVKMNQENKNMQLSKILSCIKHKIKSYSDYDDLKNCGFIYKRCYYLREQKQPYYYYMDYLDMARKAGHDVEDDYWKYPKDLRQTHAKVMEELRIISEAKILEAKKKQDEAIYNINRANPKSEKVIDDYRIRLPLDEQDIIEQAEVLHQCLIRSGYDKKFANLDTILLFILKGDERIATAEIGWNKKIKQFYCNELDLVSYKPSDELRMILDKYLKNLRIRKPKGLEISPAVI